MCEYKYSSFQEYKNGSEIVDIDYITEFIPKEDFEEYNDEIINANCLDIEAKKALRVTDEEAKRIIKKYSKCDNSTEFQKLSIKKRNKCIINLKKKVFQSDKSADLQGLVTMLFKNYNPNTEPSPDFFNGAPLYRGKFDKNDKVPLC